MSAPEIRRNDDGTLDEVVARDAVVHLEQMDDDHWWMCIESGGESVHVNLWSAVRPRISFGEVKLTEIRSRAERNL